ncbi:hypothetical protein [Actinoallomurus soli]|uniref:hypothetical protein n=1 Tax=Actinoallomurus soli TaxID=2952535 RepID=UPI00209277B6|nr:hypothetical protein [Actinoallomurus soli]MCO5973185.1 hypothetical protein [Actinoallomurus soli]
MSELGFGFWRYLLSARYEQSLWTPALRHAFPELRPQRRREVADRVARLHLLRNRLAHHEPIHRRDLAADHADLIFVASAICPHAAAWIERNSTVTAVVSRRPGPRPPAPRLPRAERIPVARRRTGGDADR